MVHIARIRINFHIDRQKRDQAGWSNKIVPAVAYEREAMRSGVKEERAGSTQIARRNMLVLKGVQTSE